MLITLTRKEHREYTVHLTNRQLLKEYRIDKNHLPVLKKAYDKYPHLYLGESALLQMLDTERAIEEYERELTNRGYKLDKIKL